MGHMGPIYSKPNEYIPMVDARVYLCGYYEMLRNCINAPKVIDPNTGHRVCSSCQRISVDSGLRLCELCNTQFIDTIKYVDPHYEVICPRCVIKHGL